MKTKLMGLAIVVVIILGFSNLGVAKDYPTRPIKMVVAFGAGGSTSMSARIIAQAAAQILEEAVLVVSKPGAGGSIGAAYASKARPDGYTLFVFNSASNGVSAALRPNIGYTNDDFALIGQYSAGQCAMVVRADRPWKTVQDVVEYAKKNPGKLKFPAGAGDTARFATELFKVEAGGLKIDRLPIHSGAELNQMLLGGHAHLGVSPASDLRGLVAAGKLRFLAFCNEERNPDFPDVPTFKEVGLPGVTIGTWYGLAAPLGVPEKILNTLRETLASIMKEKVVNRMLKNMGHTPTHKNAEDFGKFVKRMEKVYLRIGREAGIKFK